MGNMTPLLLASRFTGLAFHSANAVLIVGLLVGRGADVNARCDKGKTPLNHALDGVNITGELVAKKAKALLENGADAEAVPDEGGVPLVDAVVKGRSEAVDVLFSHQMDQLPMYE